MRSSGTRPPPVPGDAAAAACNGDIDRPIGNRPTSPLSDDLGEFADLEAGASTNVDKEEAKANYEYFPSNDDVADAPVAAPEEGGAGMTNGSAKGTARPPVVADPVEEKSPTRGGSAVLKRGRSPPKGAPARQKSLARSDSAPPDMEHADGEAASAGANPVQFSLLR